VATLAQPATRTPRRFVQVHLEDGSLCHHHRGFADHLHEVVQDQVGGSET